MESNLDLLRKATRPLPPTVKEFLANVHSLPYEKVEMCKPVFNCSIPVLQCCATATLVGVAKIENTCTHGTVKPTRFSRLYMFHRKGERLSFEEMCSFLFYELGEVQNPLGVFHLDTKTLSYMHIPHPQTGEEISLSEFTGLIFPININ